MLNVLIIESKHSSAEIMADCINYLDLNPFIYDYKISFSKNLKQFDPHLIIFNQNMFEKSRLYFNEIRDYIHPITLILTSDGIIEPHTIKSLGADFFLSKPYELETFYTLLRQANDCRLDRINV